MTNDTVPNYVLKLLIRARQSLAASIDEAGGCDHSVGICACTNKNLVAEIDRSLFNRYGTDLVDKFYHAEPTHTYTEREPGLKWARDAGSIVRELTAERILDLVGDPDL